MRQSPILLPENTKPEPNVPEILTGQTQPGKIPGHRDFLDGLRAIAALWVVLSHLWIIPCGMAARDSWVGRLTNWTLYSHFAVDIFIVLSGFCLILPVARDGRLQGGVVAFYLRRARRILPPFYAALAFSLFFTLVIQKLSHQPPQINRPALLANIFLLQDLLPKMNIFNGPFWSIAVEWRIYFLFPVLVWALPRCGKIGVLAGAALAGGTATAALLHWHPEMLLACPWYLLLFAMGLCAGSLSVERERPGEQFFSIALGALSLGGLASLVHAHPITTQGGGDFGAYLPWIDTIAGAAAASALLLLSRAPQRVRLLSWRPLVTLGTFAYSLYLVHLPCLLLFNTLLTVLAPKRIDALHHALGLLLTVPLVIGLARLFYLAFEKPFITRRKPAGQAADIRRSRGRET